MGEAIEQLIIRTLTKLQIRSTEMGSWQNKLNKHPLITT